MEKHDLGVIGLAVMGANLARNAASRGMSVAVYNRTYAKTEALVADHGHEGLTGYKDLKAFVESLEAPLRIIIMVKAGPAVDAVAEGLSPFLDEGDIIIDGGNSLYTDTERRYKTWKERGINWFGMGVSGGEEGALKGPSLMPGGEKSVWERLKPMVESMAANDFAGGDCAAYLGHGGAGHFVKMVHNGIEYAIMQLLSEAYLALKDGHKMTNDEIANAFEAWHAGPIGGYLTEISIPILRQKDDKGHGYLLDKILDQAGQKGTGRWTAIEALRLGVDAGMIVQAVNARVVSSHKERRVKLAQSFGRTHTPTGEKGTFVATLGHALEGAIMLAYAQGFALLRAAAGEYGWDLPFAEIARLWQGGCIIRAKSLVDWSNAFQASPDGDLWDLEYVRETAQRTEESLRSVVVETTQMGLYTPCLSEALTSLVGDTTARASAHFLQGLRDFFGAHTYKRIDADGTFHTQWNT